MKTQKTHSSLVVIALFGALFLRDPSALHAQKASDAALKQGIVNIFNDFKGVVGVYVRNLKTGQTIAINADSLFPTASMIKVPILCALFDKMEQGKLKYDDVLVYRDSLKYDDGITGSLRDSSRIPVSEVVHLMTSVSDNTASLWLQTLAGTGTNINEWLETNGFHQTRVNSRTPGREEMRSIYGWGVTTPREMAELVTLIRTGKAVSPGASEEMYRTLCRSYWNGEALSQIPPYVQAASKQGAVNASRSEVVLVNAPSGDYVFCVITKNQEDQSWKKENEGYVLLRKISGFLWNSFEPTSSWSPPGVKF